VEFSGLAPAMAHGFLARDLTSGAANLLGQVLGGNSGSKNLGYRECSRSTIPSNSAAVFCYNRHQPFCL